MANEVPIIPWDASGMDREFFFMGRGGGMDKNLKAGPGRGVAGKGSKSTGLGTLPSRRAGRPSLVCFIFSEEI